MNKTTGLIFLIFIFSDSFTFCQNKILLLNGKTKDITITASIKKSGDGVEIDSNFTVNTDDFAIDIPSVVSKKVTKKVAVKLDVTLK